MERVSSLDAGMLYAETLQMPMHMMGVIVLDPTDAEGAFSEDRLRELFTERLVLIEPFRRRLVQGPLGLGDPNWIEDAAIDLDHHVRTAKLPGPGGPAEFAALVGDVAGTLIPRDKPLWQVTFVEGLEGGRVALVAKIHHAMMDGGRGAGLLGNLFTIDPEGETFVPPQDEWIPEKEPSTLVLAADAARSLAAKPWHAAQAIAGVGQTAWARSRRPRDEDAAHLFEAPATAFNGALEQQRSVALADVDLDEIKATAHAHGVTLNDIVLEASTAALRTWLLKHGGLPDRPLIANIPVAISLDPEGGAGNRVSMILIHLPVQEEDPVARLRAINEETTHAKETHSEAGGDVFTQFTDLLTNVTVPWVLTHAMELYSSSRLADRLPPLWNIVISNVPGPPIQLYCAGARVEAIYPLGPVQQGSGLNITVLSTESKLHFGAMACRDMVPDVSDVATAFADEVAVLGAAAPV